MGARAWRSGIWHGVLLSGCGSQKSDDATHFDGFEWDYTWVAGSSSDTALRGDDHAVEAGGAGECWDVYLGSVMGDAVGTGNQADGSNEYDCLGGTGREVVFGWNAPESGVWTFTTDGSPNDTVLEIRLGCDGPTAVCNDDSGSGLTSRGTVDLDAGDEVIIIVDSYSASSESSVVLNIY